MSAKKRAREAELSLAVAYLPRGEGAGRIRNEFRPGRQADFSPPRRVTRPPRNVATGRARAHDQREHALP